jgi:hypothetical protein
MRSSLSRLPEVPRVGDGEPPGDAGGEVCLQRHGAQLELVGNDGELVGGDPGAETGFPDALCSIGSLALRLT